MEFSKSKFEDISKFVEDSLGIKQSEEILIGVRGEGNDKYVVIVKNDYNGFLAYEEPKKV